MERSLVGGGARRPPRDTRRVSSPVRRRYGIEERAMRGPSFTMIYYCYAAGYIVAMSALPALHQGWSRPTAVAPLTACGWEAV